MPGAASGPSRRGPVETAGDAKGLADTDEVFTGQTGPEVGSGARCTARHRMAAPIPQDPGPGSQRSTHTVVPEGLRAWAGDHTGRQVRHWNRSHAQHARRAGEDAVAAGAPGKRHWRSGWAGAGTEVHDGVVQPVGIKGSRLSVRQPRLSTSVPGPPAQSTSAGRLSTL